MNDKKPKAVAVSVLKGGLGKSTTSINLARELAHRNGRSLLVDLDPNGHTTLNLGQADAYHADSDIGDVLLDGGDRDPASLIVNVTDGLDLLPSNDDLEDVQSDLQNAQMGSARLKKHVVDPLLGDDYDFIILDCPAMTGKLNDNAMYAAQNLMIPLRPENGALSGLQRTVERLIKPSREYFDLDLLAVVPTDLSDRIDYDTRTRELVQSLTERPFVAERLPNFAFIPPATWEALDAGPWQGELPKPGIRSRAAIDNSLRHNLPLRDFDPECDQLESYAELARIVETGEVVRDE